MAQQLGPSSYVREIAGVASQANASVPSGINRSIGEGGGYAPISYAQGGEFAAAAANQNRMIESIVGFANKLAEPTLLRKQQEQFVFGMQLAAQGKALTEIKKDQPWLSRIVGDTFVTEGARKYTAASRSVDLATDMITNMEELKKLSPDEFREYYMSKMQESMTGDAGADQEIIAAGLNNAAPLMGQHARANFDYTQDQLADAYSKNLYSITRAAQARQARVGIDMTQEEVDNLNYNDIQNALPAPPNLDPKRAQAALQSVLTASANTGNVAAVKAFNLIQNNNPNVDPVDVTAGQIAFRAAEAQATQNYLRDPNVRVALGNAEGLINAAQQRLAIAVERGNPTEVENARQALVEITRSINADAKARTGSDVPLIDESKVVSGATYSINVGNFKREISEQDAAYDRQAQIQKFGLRTVTLSEGYERDLTNVIETTPPGEPLTARLSQDTYNAYQNLVQNKILTADEASSEIKALESKIQEQLNRIQIAREKTGFSGIVAGSEAMFDILEQNNPGLKLKVARDQSSQISEQEQITNNEITEQGSAGLLVSMNAPSVANSPKEHPMARATDQQKADSIFMVTRDAIYREIEDPELAGKAYSEALIIGSIDSYGVKGRTDSRVAVTFEAASAGYNPAVLSEVIPVVRDMQHFEMNNPKYAGWARRTLQMYAGDKTDRFIYLQERLDANPDMTELEKEKLWEKAFSPEFTPPNRLSSSPYRSAGKPPEGISKSYVDENLIGPTGWIAKITGSQTTSIDVDDPVYQNIRNNVSIRAAQIMQENVTIDEKKAVQMAAVEESSKWDFQGTPVPVSRDSRSLTIAQIAQEMPVFKGDREVRFEPDVANEAFSFLARNAPDMRAAMAVLPKPDERILDVKVSSSEPKGSEDIYTYQPGTEYTFTVLKPNGQREIRYFKIPLGSESKNTDVIEGMNVQSFSNGQDQSFLISNQSNGYASRFTAKELSGFYRLRLLAKDK